MLQMLNKPIFTSISLAQFLCLPKHGNSDGRADNSWSKGPGFDLSLIQWDFASNYMAYLFPNNAVILPSAGNHSFHFIMSDIIKVYVALSIYIIVIIIIQILRLCVDGLSHSKKSFTLHFLSRLFCHFDALILLIPL